MELSLGVARDGPAEAVFADAARDGSAAAVFADDARYDPAEAASADAARDGLASPDQWPDSAGSLAPVVAPSAISTRGMYSELYGLELYDKWNKTMKLSNFRKEGGNVFCHVGEVEGKNHSNSSTEFYHTSQYLFNISASVW